MPGIWTNEGEGWRLIGRVEALIHPTRLGQGNTVASISDELLDTFEEAYEAAAAAPVDLPMTTATSKAPRR